MMKVSIVPREHLDTCWLKVEPLLKKATDRTAGRWTTTDLREAILTDASNLWVVFDKDIVAAATTRFVDYPNRRMLVLDHLGGDDLGEWFSSFLSMMDKWALANKCDGIETYARHGWAKLAVFHGWDRPYSVFEKDLRSK